MIVCNKTYLKNSHLSQGSSHSEEKKRKAEKNDEKRCDADASRLHKRNESISIGVKRSTFLSFATRRALLTVELLSRLDSLLLSHRIWSPVCGDPLSLRRIINNYKKKIAKRKQKKIKRTKGWRPTFRTI